MTDASGINCEEALRLLTGFLDGELSPTEYGDVEAHLQRCLSCCSRAEFERRLKDRLAALGSVGPRPELEQRVRAAIARFPRR